MDGANANALEWALALLHAPAERHTLRQKPLPEGIDRLLGIAAGVLPRELAEAVRAFGVPEARVREAAQFYAREVLFFPQADAYRVLGVNAVASSDQIKAHHRLLQHWLHPDRQRSEDDAIFAARVNSAWNLVRTPDRRQAYDVSLQSQPLPGGGDGNRQPRGVQTWVPVQEVPRDHWRHRLPLLALTTTCLLLAWMILRDQEHRPALWNPGASDPSIGSAGVEIPAALASALPQADNATARSTPASRTAAQDRRAAHEARDPRRQHDQGGMPSQRLLGTAPQRPAREHASTIPSSTATPEPATASMQFERGRQMAAGSLLPRSSTQPTAESSSAAPPAVEAAWPVDARIQSAQQTGEQFLRFMAATTRPLPPIWNSPAIQSSAGRLRHELHANGDLRLSPPQWRIQQASAALSATYTLQGDAVGSGLLSADLVWREGRWLVTGMSVEQAR